MRYIGRMSPFVLKTLVQFGRASAIYAAVLVLMSFLMVGNAVAGEWSSGGGNAMVCFRRASTAAQVLARGNGALMDRDIQQIRSIEVLDLYLARRMVNGRGIPVSLIRRRPHETNDELLGRLIERTRHWVPVWANRIEESRARFEAGTQFHYPEGVEPVRDTGFLGNPSSGCVIATIVAQENQNLHWDLRLLRHPAFEANPLNHAVLMLHEYVYHYLRRHGATQAARAQRVVGLLISTDPMRTFRDALGHPDLGLGLTQPPEGQDYGSSMNAWFDGNSFPGRLYPQWVAELPRLFWQAYEAELSSNLFDRHRLFLTRFDVGTRTRAILARTTEAFRQLRPGVVSTFTQEFDQFVEWLQVGFESSLADSLFSQLRAASGDFGQVQAGNIENSLQSRFLQEWRSRIFLPALALPLNDYIPEQLD